MQFGGNYTLKAKNQTVWDTLLDPEYIIKLTPEISTIRDIGPDEYLVTSHIKVGPFKRKFEGNIRIERIQPPSEFKIHIVQNSPMGNVTGICSVCLADDGALTQINYEGDVEMTGMLRKLGMPLVQKMIHPLIHQFFEKFEEDMLTS